MSNQTELEASLLSRTRGMTIEEMTAIMEKYGIGMLGIYDHEIVAQNMMHFIKVGEIPHAELM